MHLSGNGTRRVAAPSARWLDCDYPTRPPTTDED